MNTLIYGSGPIGQWLALRLQQGGKDVTLLARNETYNNLQRHGITLTDGFTGEKETAQVKLTDHLAPEDRYDLIIVTMNKINREKICPILSANKHLKMVLVMGNDVSGFERYCEQLPKDKVLLGFPGGGGGWDGDDLVFVDKEKPEGKRGKLFLGELEVGITDRMQVLQKFFESACLPVSLEQNMDGWLKYHFAFMGPTVGLIFKHNGDLKKAAEDNDGLRKYVLACREAGNVLAKVGYTKRQPPVFNLFYWLPLWIAPKVFRKMFSSRFAEVGFGLHVKVIGDEFRALNEEFSAIKKMSGVETPNMDGLLACFSG